MKQRDAGATSRAWEKENVNHISDPCNAQRYACFNVIDEKLLRILRENQDPLFSSSFPFSFFPDGL